MATFDPCKLPPPLPPADLRHVTRNGTPCRVSDVSEPDPLGRCQFTMEWNGIHPLTGQAYLHGLVFFAVPCDHYSPREAYGSTDAPRAAP